MKRKRIHLLVFACALFVLGCGRAPFDSGSANDDSQGTRPFADASIDATTARHVVGMDYPSVGGDLSGTTNNAQVVAAHFPNGSLDGGVLQPGTVPLSALASCGVDQLVVTGPDGGYACTNSLNGGVISNGTLPGSALELGTVPAGAMAPGTAGQVLGTNPAGVTAWSPSVTTWTIMALGDSLLSGSNALNTGNVAIARSALYRQLREHRSDFDFTGSQVANMGEQAVTGPPFNTCVPGALLAAQASNFVSAVGTSYIGCPSIVLHVGGGGDVIGGRTLTQMETDFSTLASDIATNCPSAIVIEQGAAPLVAGSTTGSSLATYLAQIASYNAYVGSYISAHATTWKSGPAWTLGYGDFQDDGAHWNQYGSAKWGASMASYLDEQIMGTPRRGPSTPRRFVTRQPYSAVQVASAGDYVTATAYGLEPGIYVDSGANSGSIAYAFDFLPKTIPSSNFYTIAEYGDYNTTPSQWTLGLSSGKLNLYWGANSGTIFAGSSPQTSMDLDVLMLPGLWYRFVIWYDAASETLGLYANGQLVGIIQSLAPVAFTAKPLYLGSDGSNRAPLPGYFSRLTVYQGTSVRPGSMAAQVAVEDDYYEGKSLAPGFGSYAAMLDDSLTPDTYGSNAMTLAGGAAFVGPIYQSGTLPPRPWEEGYSPPNNGDLAASYVASISGASNTGGTIPVNAGALNWGSSQTPEFEQGSTAVHNGNAVDWVWAPQANTDATSTTGRSADAVVNLSVPPNTSTTEAALLVKRAGTQLMSFGAYPGLTSYSCIQFGAGGTCTIASNGSNVYFDPSSTTAFQAGGTGIANVTSVGIWPNSDLTYSFGQVTERWENVNTLNISAGTAASGAGSNGTHQCGMNAAPLSNASGGACIFQSGNPGTNTDGGVSTATPAPINFDIGASTNVVSITTVGAAGLVCIGPASGGGTCSAAKPAIATGDGVNLGLNAAATSDSVYESFDGVNYCAITTAGFGCGGPNYTAASSTQGFTEDATNTHLQAPTATGVVDFAAAGAAATLSIAPGVTVTNFGDAGANNQFNTWPWAHWNPNTSDSSVHAFGSWTLSTNHGGTLHCWGTGRCSATSTASIGTTGSFDYLVSTYYQGSGNATISVFGPCSSSGCASNAGVFQLTFTSSTDVVTANVQQNENADDFCPAAWDVWCNMQNN